MKYDHTVKVNGKFYKVGEEVPGSKGPRRTKAEKEADEGKEAEK